MDTQEQVRKNILQELRTLHEAKCPNIVQCYGSFYDNGVIYSVLEYMDGGCLAQILKSSKKINEKYLSKIAKQVGRPESPRIGSPLYLSGVFGNLNSMKLIGIPKELMR
jgi:serine/threonine protein kinase